MKKIVIILLLFIIIIVWLVARPRPLIKGKIAIVLDDWGYNLNNLSILEEIKYPLTASVLPNIAYSQKVAQELRARGLEVILHLPMEPEEKLNLEKDTVKAAMDKTEIARILGNDLASIVFARGVSNHMGSKVTSDLRVMRIIFGELKKRRLYFLDSYVTAKSICPQLARQMKLAYFKRDVFLDNLEEKGYIQEQINQLKSKAAARGYAIGIGHDRKVTLEVLREVMPQLSREGYQFVFLSELKNRAAR